MKRAAALPMVLMSLGLVGALAVGGAFASRRFVSDSRFANRALELRPAAEQAVVLALAQLDSAALALPPGSTIAGGQIVTTQAVTLAWITVLGGGSVWVTAEAATVNKPLYVNRLAVLCRVVVGERSGCEELTWFELP